MTAPGVSTVTTYTPKEILGPGDIDSFVKIPVTVTKGQSLVKGEIVGIVGSMKTVKTYLAAGAAASCSVPAAGASNIGDGTCSTPIVQDAYTNNDTWTLTCLTKSSNAGTFSVVGTRSGNVGTAIVAVEFSYPATSAYEIKFTIADGSADYDVGDTWTFTTTGAAATVAHGIIDEAVDASSNDEQSAMYVKGQFETANLTGLDDAAYINMLAKDVGPWLVI